MKFIPDKEINLYKKDLLGTRTYVDTLVDIIKTCDTPFTIGLLGGWGSGKSSIVKTLQEKFNNDTNSKIKVFIYDAWKYSKDSFRRTFILELLNYFNLDFEKSIIKEKLYLTESQVTEWGLSKIFTYKRSFSKTFGPIIHPEQFERIFIEIVNKITSKPLKKWRYIKSEPNLTCQKLVIAIDNIDRCHKELAVEMLLTIKNFLSIENVIFIVPVDEEGLKNYLKLSNQDANEFLRKLFNTTIKIKKFTEADLFDFCKNLNEKYGLGLPDIVLSIVAQEFAKNPRRIIQFLNNLQSEILLSKKIEELGLVKPKGVISDNLPVLAKLLIIKEEWPELYKAISEDPDLLNRINRAFRDKEVEQEGDTYKVKSENITLTKEQYRFLLRTSPFSTERLEPFIVNRDIFKDIPDEINTLTVSQDWNTIKEKYIKTGSISLIRLINFISQKLDTDVIKRGLYQTSGFNLLSLVFKIANDEEYHFELENLYATSFFQLIVTVCEMGEIESLIFEFNPKELVKFSEWLYEREEKGLVNNIIKAINKISEMDIKEKEIETIKIFVERYESRPKQLERIKNKFSQILIHWPQYFNDFQNILEKSSASKCLITIDLMRNFIDTLKANPSQDKTLEKVNILNALCKNKTMSKELVVLYIGKIIQFANTNDWNAMNFWFNALKIPCKRMKEDMEISKKVYELLNNRYQWLFSQYTAGQISELSIKVYKAFLDLCLLLYFSTDQYDNQIMQWMNNFFVRNESPEIYFYINELYSKIIDTFEVYTWPFSQQIINRFINTGWPQKKKFALNLNKMLLKTTDEKGLTQQQIDAILSQYLNIAKSFHKEQSEEAKNWLREVIKNGLILEKLQTKINSISNPEELRNLFDVISSLKRNELLKQVINKILLQTPCENIGDVIIELINKKTDIKMVIESLQTRIEQLNVEDNNQHRICLEKILGVKEIVDEKLSEEAIDKIKPLLASNNKEKQLFALNLLDNLQIIPETRKGLLKELLNALNYEGWQNEEKELLNKIKNRLKVPNRA